MIFQATGSMLVQLMQFDRPGERDTEWLLFGPTDEEVVTATEPSRITSPEAPFASAPSTASR